MQPQNPLDPSTNQQPEAGPQPIVPPAAPEVATPQPADTPQPVGSGPQFPQTQDPAAAAAATPGADDPGKILSIVGLITAIFTPLIGIILSAVGMQKSKKAGYSGKLGLAGIIVGIAVIVLVILTFVIIFLITASAVNNTASSLNKDSDSSITTDRKEDEAFGVKMGMERTAVEKVLGEPEPLTSFQTEGCTEMAAALVDAAGYDTNCYYKVGTRAAGSSTVPNTSVKYLDNKLVGATEVAEDGTITTLSDLGVSVIEP